MKFRHLLIFFLLLSVSIAYSQTEQPTFQLHVEGTITNLDDTPQPGVMVQVMQGGKVLFSSTTDGSGSYSYDLPLNSDYSIIVSKPGFATKKYSVSTRGVPPERATSKFSTIEASLSIFEKVEGIDYSMLNQPLNKYTYNANKENFEYDKAYLDQMLGGLQALMAQQQAALNRMKELEKNYQAAIKSGDKAFQKNDWAAAKAAYSQASGLKPNEAWPKDQLVQIDKIIKEQDALNKKKEEDAKKAAEEAKKAAAAAELNAKYAAAIKKGDDAFNAKGWAAAKLGYNEALGLKPGEQYPKDKLAAIEKAIADEAAAKNKAETDAKYTAAIKKGDDGFTAKNWIAAKAGYNEALSVKPTEQYPKDKLAAIDKAIADEAAAKNKAETDSKYSAAIKKGDDGFTAKNWIAAKAGYNEALSVKPAEQYPKDKLAAIDKAIADEAAAKAKADADAKAKAEADAKYLAAVKRGDDGFAKKDWSNAKAAYTEASGLKPAEQYPKTQLAAIEKVLADDAAAKAKADADAKAKAELDAKYAAAIKKGDEAFNTKNWANAKAGYTEALGIKSSEQYPKDKLAAIDKSIADENAAKSKAELDAKYSAAIKKGDEAFSKKDWSNAKAGYNEALSVKPNEQYPKDKIAAIDKSIADEAAAKAKAEADSKAKAELEAKYSAAIKKGDEGFGKKDWANAKLAYTEAGGLKPAEQYPKTQLAAIDKILSDDAAAKAKAEADAKAKAELEAKYAASIKKGDDAFGKKDWPTARTGYNEALGFKPTEQYPKTQLAAIEKAIADEKANMDAAAKAKAEAELNSKYQDAIKRADEGFAKKDWNNSKSAYNQALGLKPAEKYPKDQIAIIDKNIADDAAAKAKADADAKAKAEIEAKYAASIKKGDDGFNTKNWASAKTGYTDALAIKPSEQYPKDKLAAIDKAIADENANKSKAEIDAKYNAALKIGDAAFAKKDWNTAKGGYNEALGIKPSEQYPKDKLAAIDKAITDENANKSKGELDAKYNLAIKKGDEAFAKKDWPTSKSGYTEASIIKSNEQYPKDKLAAIDAEIAKGEAAKAAAELKLKYDAAIKRADSFFAKKNWPDAKAGYYEALEYMPDEKYPKMQIGAINKAMTGDVPGPNDQKYKEAISRADNYFGSKQYKEAKKNYEEALTYKGGDLYAKSKLIEIEKFLNSDSSVKTDDHKKALLAKYPPGVSEETIPGSGVTIIQRVVVKGGDVWVYQKKIFSFGVISYFRDGETITELIFENETKP